MSQRPRQSNALLIGILALCGVLWAALIAVAVLIVMRNAGPIREAVAELARPVPPAPSAPENDPPLPQVPQGDLAHGATLLEPVGDVTSWFPADAYPLEAVRRGEQGRVVLAVKVGADGWPRACETLTSSGSAALDAGTCQRVKDFGRFRIRHDNKGNLMEYWGRMPPVRWVLPEIPPR